MTRQEELVAYLFDGRPHPLLDELRRWMDESARFSAFAAANRDKIRKKIRVTTEPASALDVRAELEVACRLLSDRRFELVYEPFASAKVRGPDFAVTYRANQVFYVEVARIRQEEKGEERLVRILLDKLGQMQPGAANLLAIHGGEALVQSLDLTRRLQEIKLRAEGKDLAFYALSRYSGPPAFYKDFLLLSGIVLWGGGAQVWINKQARPGLEEKVIRLAGGLLGA